MSIIKGYKGIIDLDLSLVPKIYIKAAIEQHYKDIEEYKKYQLTLKPENRYENTIERIEKQNIRVSMIKLQKETAERNRRYDLCKNIRNNLL